MGRPADNVLLRLQELEREVLVLSSLMDRNADELGVRLTIKDTEFLVRTLANMQLSGNDASVFNEVFAKIQTLHKVLLEKGVEM